MSRLLWLLLIAVTGARSVTSGYSADQNRPTIRESLGPTHAQHPAGGARELLPFSEQVLVTCAPLAPLTRMVCREAAWRQ